MRSARPPLTSGTDYLYVVPLILSYIGKKLIGISPLEPGSGIGPLRCRYDAMYIPGYRYVPLRSAALRR